VTRNFDPTVGVSTDVPEIDDSYVELPGREGEPEPGTVGHPSGQPVVGRYDTTLEGRRSAELAAEASDPYASATNDELRVELERRGLATSGNKAELQARLREADAAE
jgi:hypothetical protein